MKKRCVSQVVIFAVVMILMTIFFTSVFAEETTVEMGVAYRGHVQNKGNFPQLDNSYLDGPTELGTRGEGLRIEGLQLKLTGTVPEGMQIRYNVHVQNKGWLHPVDDPSSWAKDGEFAGTRGNSLRIEAIKIVLLDANGNASNGYSVLYRGHVQNVGNQPVAADDWLKDGAPLGTTGSGLRLEAIQVKILKTDSSPELEAYQALMTTINGLAEKDYTPSTWAELQTVIAKNTVTFEGNTVKEIKAATAAIQSAYDKLVAKEPALVYDTPGTYGPASGTQVVNGDVVVKADGVTLQNLQIDGDLIMSNEQTAETTGISVGGFDDGQIEIKPVIDTRSAAVCQTVVYGYLDLSHNTRVIFMSSGGVSQIYTILAALSGQLTASTSIGGTTTGTPMEVSVGSSGSGSAGTVTVGGTVGSLTCSSPGIQVGLLPGTLVQQLAISPTAPNTQVTAATTTQIYNLAIQASGVSILGQGQVDNAEILGNGASFERRPNSFTVGPEVTILPAMPSPPAPPAPDPQPQQPQEPQPGEPQPGAVIS